MIKFPQILALTAACCWHASYNASHAGQSDRSAIFENICPRALDTGIGDEVRQYGFITIHKVVEAAIGARTPSLKPEVTVDGDETVTNWSLEQGTGFHFVAVCEYEGTLATRSGQVPIGARYCQRREKLGSGEPVRFFCAS